MPIRPPSDRLDPATRPASARPRTMPRLTGGASSRHAARRHCTGKGDPPFADPVPLAFLRSFRFWQYRLTRCVDRAVRNACRRRGERIINSERRNLWHGELATPHPFERVARALLAVVLGMSALLVAAVATAPRAAAAPRAGRSSTRRTRSIPAPPPSSFAGSAGGDGWGLAMTPAAVYNVFHHQPTLQVACHLQSNAQACWTAPKTITDGSGNNSPPPPSPGSGWTRPPDTCTSSPHVPRTTPQVWSASTPPSRHRPPEPSCSAGSPPLSAVGRRTAEFHQLQRHQRPRRRRHQLVRLQRGRRDAVRDEEHHCCASA